MTQPPNSDIFTPDAVNLLSSVAGQLKDWAGNLKQPRAADLRGIVSGLLDVADDLETKIERRSPLQCTALARIAAGDLAEAIRGCSEAGYFDDDVKLQLEALAEDLDDSTGVRRPPLLLTFNDEDIESTGRVQTLIRKAAGLEE